MVLRLGTRGSRLALWQADHVAGMLRAAGFEVVIIPIKTLGDKSQTGPIAELGAPGVFTKEIQRELLDGRIDLAVHSLKDLPVEAVSGIRLVATPPRGPVRDILLTRSRKTLDDLPAGSLIGTGSLRRRCQVQYRCNSQFQFADVRGNIETRLAKLDAGEYDALILAEAALDRLGLAEAIRQPLEPPDFLPAVGQGAIGIEMCNDAALLPQVAAVMNDPATLAAVTAERAMLRHLHGGCIAPIAALATVNFDDDAIVTDTADCSGNPVGLLTLQGRIFSPDGKVMLESAITGAADHAVALGVAIAEQLYDLGADRIIAMLRSSTPFD